MLVRLAQLEDFEALVPLMQQFAGVRDEGLFERYKSVLESPDFLVLVATFEGRVIGYAVAQSYLPRLRSGEESVRLNDLLVETQQRRLGAGRALFEAVKHWCLVRGARYLEWQSSKEALRFYEHLGLQGNAFPRPEYPFFEIRFPEQN